MREAQRCFDIIVDLVTARANVQAAGGVGGVEFLGLPILKTQQGKTRRISLSKKVSLCEAAALTPGCSEFKESIS